MEEHRLKIFENSAKKNI